jgi:hypothetical protein
VIVFLLDNCDPPVAGDSHFVENDKDGYPPVASAW